MNDQECDKYNTLIVRQLQC